MQVPADLLFCLLAIVAAAGFRRRRERLLLVAILMPLIALALDIARLFPRVSVGLGPVDAVLAALIALLIADIEGLPAPIARRVRIGLRSREWEFDHRLHLYREQLDRQLLSYPPSRQWDAYRRWQARTMKAGRRAVRGIASLKPPDAQWELVQQGYVDLYEEILGRVQRDEPPNDEDTAARGEALKEAAATLRRQYRASVQSLVRRR